MLGCVCPATEGRHEFKSIMTESVAPSTELLETCGVSGLEDSDDIAKIIIALSRRRYAVVCQACGMNAGCGDDNTGKTEVKSDAGK